MLLFFLLYVYCCDTLPAGIKDFMCELCGKTFSERTTLETHKLIHTGKCLMPGRDQTKLEHTPPFVLQDGYKLNMGAYNLAFFPLLVQSYVNRTVHGQTRIDSTAKIMQQEERNKRPVKKIKVMFSVKSELKGGRWIGSVCYKQKNGNVAFLKETDTWLHLLRS